MLEVLGEKLVRRPVDEIHIFLLHIRLENELDVQIVVLHHVQELLDVLFSILSPEQSSILLNAVQHCLLQFLNVLLSTHGLDELELLCIIQRKCLVYLHLSPIPVLNDV